MTIHLGEYSLVEKGPFVPVPEAHLSRFQRPICPGSGTGTKGSLRMPKAFCTGWPTNRDRRTSTWPLWLALAGGPVVPVGEVNWDMSGFFLKG